MAETTAERVLTVEENDAWSRELDALSATMRADLLASGIASENIEGQIAQAVARVQARRMNLELMELV